MGRRNHGELQAREPRVSREVPVVVYPAASVPQVRHSVTYRGSGDLNVRFPGRDLAEFFSAVDASARLFFLQIVFFLAAKCG